MDCLKVTTVGGRRMGRRSWSPAGVRSVSTWSMWKRTNRAPLVSHKTYNVVLGRLSPDGRWISFTARVKANKAMIAVAPTRWDAPGKCRRGAWIKIADEEAPEDRGGLVAGWGKLLYSRGGDGHNCLLQPQRVGIGGLAASGGGVVFRATF